MIYDWGLQHVLPLLLGMVLGSVLTVVLAAVISGARAEERFRQVDELARRRHVSRGGAAAVAWRREEKR
jgi:hypothetical protein